MTRKTSIPSLLLMALICAPWSSAWSQDDGELECGSLTNSVGPYDYYSQEPDAKRLLENVETHHFNEEVRELRHGETAVSPMADLDYVLRAFPNHPQALMLVARFQDAGGDPGRFRTAECYFERARRFAPQDPSLHVLYANRLASQGKNQAALKEYEAALEIAPDYAEAHYNIGLLLVKLGRLDEARAHAQKAYAAGFPLSGLRRQLMSRHAWKDSP